MGCLEPLREHHEASTCTKTKHLDQVYTALHVLRPISETPQDRAQIHILAHACANALSLQPNIVPVWGRTEHACLVHAVVD